MTITVTTTKADLQLAERIANERYNESRRMGLGNLAKNYSHDMERDGVLSEIAVAKGLGFDKFAPTVNSFKGSDIQTNLQVRGTAYSTGNLIIKPKDDTSHIYILTTFSSYPKHKIIGYCFGSEAKTLGTIKNGCLWIPQSKLTPIENIFTEIRFLENFTRPLVYTSSQTFTVIYRN